MEYALILLVAFIVLIIRAYYLDNDNDRKEFRFSLRNVGNKVVEFGFILLLLFGIKSAYKLFIPLNKNHGTEFNSEREKIGIPTIGNNWERRNPTSEQFTITWWKKDDLDGHFKKIIEYGITNVKFESDYYKNNLKSGTYVWSKYDYNTNVFEYFLEKPNTNIASISESGILIAEEPRIKKKISKSEFDAFILN